jgi:hypothetical protein
MLDKLSLGNLSPLVFGSNNFTEQKSAAMPNSSQNKLKYKQKNSNLVFG